MEKGRQATSPTHQGTSKLRITTGKKRRKEHSDPHSHLPPKLQKSTKSHPTESHKHRNKQGKGLVAILTQTTHLLPTSQTHRTSQCDRPHLLQHILNHMSPQICCFLLAPILINRLLRLLVQMSRDQQLQHLEPHQLLLHQNQACRLGLLLLLHLGIIS